MTAHTGDMAEAIVTEYISAPMRALNHEPAHHGGTRIRDDCYKQLIGGGLELRWTVSFLITSISYPIVSKR